MLLEIDPDTQNTQTSLYWIDKISGFPEYTDEMFESDLQEYCTDEAFDQVATLPTLPTIPTRAYYREQKVVRWPAYFPHPSVVPLPLQEPKNPA